MRSVINAFVATLVLWGSVPVAHATDETKLLPEMSLSMPNGEVLPVTALSQSSSWVLAVVDAGLPTGRGFLDALTSKSDVFNERLWIVVIGTTEDFQQLMKDYDKLVQVRWLHADMAVLDQLRLPGTPVLLGLISGRSIAWQQAGIPQSPDQLPLMVRSWISQPDVSVINSSQP